MKQHNVEPSGGKSGVDFNNITTILLYKGHVFGQNKVCQFSLFTICFINYIKQKGQFLILNFGQTFSKFVIFKLDLFNSNFYNFK